MTDTEHGAHDGANWAWHQADELYGPFEKLGDPTPGEDAYAILIDAAEDPFDGDTSLDAIHNVLWSGTAVDVPSAEYCQAFLAAARQVYAELQKNPS